MTQTNDLNQSTLVADKQVVIDCQFCTPFWHEHPTLSRTSQLKLSRNQWVTIEWPLTQIISAPGVLVHISVLEGSVHDAQCVVTTQLQQESSITIYISINMSVNHPSINRHHPKCALNSPRRIVHSLVLIFNMAQLISSTNSRYSWPWAVCLY